ncbi:MAG: V-type ATPase subunit [Clostridia bacterium]|nr:V-type ATPase subunit [Clostridia bacterium]
MVKSYGFAVGNLRARENTLLSKSDFATLMAAKSVEELSALIGEKSGGVFEKMSVPELLSKKQKALWEYITDIAPDMDIFAPFLYENDFHNLKAILKAVVGEKDFSSLLKEPSTVESELIATAVKEKRFDILPELLRETAIKAYDILTKSGDTQACDCVIDAALTDARMKTANKTGNKTIIELISIDAFYKNIKVALRSAKAGKSPAFLDEVLSENGIVSIADLKAAAISGEEKVLELLSSKTNAGGKEAAECYKASPSSFEKFADNMVLLAAKKCKSVTIGIEPLIGYTVACLTEIKNLRIIYSGIKTGQSSEKIEERLREVYG